MTEYLKLIRCCDIGGRLGLQSGRIQEEEESDTRSPGSRVDHTTDVGGAVYA